MVLIKGIINLYIIKDVPLSQCRATKERDKSYYNIVRHAEKLLLSIYQFYCCRGLAAI